jgi:AcrR family transcriptional regulator
MTTSSSPAAPRRRARLLPEQRRENLLRAVEDVVTERGYQGATVPRVVARAGIAQGSFYRYFRDVDAAVLALMQRAVAPVIEAATALDFARVRTATDLEWELLRFYRTLARVLVAHPAVVREALLVAPTARGELAGAMSGLLRSLREVARRLITTHAGRPPFRAIGDPEAAAAAIVGMILGAAQEAFATDQGFDAERWANEMARFEAGALLDPRWAVGAKSPAARAPRRRSP